MHALGMLGAATVFMTTDHDVSTDLRDRSDHLVQLSVTT
jgi:hypothetical protein